MVVSNDFFTDYEVVLMVRSKFGKHYNSQISWFSAVGFLIACNSAMMSLRTYRVWGGTLCHIPKLYWIKDMLGGKTILGLANKGTLRRYFLLQKLFLLLECICPLGRLTNNTSLNSSLYPLTA